MSPQSTFPFTIGIYGPLDVPEPDIPGWISTALSVIGRAENSLGPPADIVASLEGQTLRRIGDTLGFGPLDLSSPNAVIGVLPAENIAPGAGGAGGGGVALTYTWNTQTFGPPGPNEIRVNVAHPYTTVATMWLDDTAGGVDVKRTLMLLQPGQILYVEDAALPGLFGSFAVNGTPMDRTDHVEITVAWRGNGSALVNNQAVNLYIGAATAGTPAIDSVTNQMLRNSTALSVMGRASDSLGDPADIVSTADFQVLRRSGAALGWGTLDNASLNNMAANTMKGRLATSGVPQDLSTTQVTGLLDLFSSTAKGLTPAPGAGLGATHYLRADGSWQIPPGGGGGGGAPTDAQYILAATNATLPNSKLLSATAPITFTSSTGVLSIANGAIDNTKLSNMVASTVKGRIGSNGVPQDLTGAQVTSLLSPFTTAAQGVVPPAAGGGTLNFLRADGAWAAPLASAIDVLWVGATAPADASVEIWYDTDEPALELIADYQRKLALNDWLPWGTTNTIQRTTAGTVNIAVTAGQALSVNGPTTIPLDQWRQWGGVNTIRRTTAGGIELDATSASSFKVPNGGQLAVFSPTVGQAILAVSGSISASTTLDLVNDQWIRWSGINGIRRTAGGGIVLSSTNHVTILNNQFLHGVDTGGTARQLVGLGSDNVLYLGGPAGIVTINVQPSVNVTGNLAVSGTLSGTGAARAAGFVTGSSGAPGPGAFGFTCTRGGVGIYTVTWSTARANNTYPVLVSLTEFLGYIITATPQTTHADIRIQRTDSVLVDSNFAIAAF